MLKSATRYLVVFSVLVLCLAVSAFAYDVQGGTVTTSSSVNIRQEATTASQSLGKLGNETRVAVLDELDGWYKIAYNGTVGYMSSDYVETQPIMNIECGGAQVTTAVLNMRSGPGTDNSIVTKLYEGNTAKIIGINNGWFKVQFGGNTGYIHPDYVKVVSYNAPTVTTYNPTFTLVPATGTGTTAEATGTRQDILAYADKYLGCKYVYGGSSPSGFDCSGFTMYVFSNFGISLSHSSATQYSNAVKINKSDLKVGDLIFFSQTRGGSKVGHVGIYAGNDQFIHACSPGKGVRYDSLSSDYYTSHYIGCGRVIDD